MGDDSMKQIIEGNNVPASQSNGEVTFGEDKDFGVKLKVVSWNINGMRTLDIPEILKQLDASIVMVQETKISRNQLDQSQVIPPGYSSYFSFSTNRIGYSGVATFCKDEWTPSKAEDGLCMRNSSIIDNVGCYPEFSDAEESHVKFANSDGRTVITQHNVKLPNGSVRPLTVINVYCPRLRDEPGDPTNNTDFKMAFHELLHRRAQLLVESGSFVALAGDINISHRWIDHCDGDPKTFVVNDFRKLLDKFLSNGFLDSFRMFYPDRKSAFTCWNTRLNARANNYGTRIDYIFVDKQLAMYLEKAEIHSDIMGSDHCPISVTFHSLQPVSQIVPPSFASKYYPEFKRKQTSLKEFVLASQHQINNCEIGTFQSELTSKKRPLPPEKDFGKCTSSKRVQTSLKSFFVRNSNETVVLAGPSKDTDILLNHERENKSFSSSSTKASEAWKKLMKAPEVPLCQGHKVPCLKRTVKKKGMNFGREFWSCPHGIGKNGDPNANCNFFQWVNSAVAKNNK